jgi:hypothetical protein
MSFLIARDGCSKRQRHALDQQAHKKRANTKLARSVKRVGDLEKYFVKIFLFF